jgi:hypothetical protein
MNKILSKENIYFTFINLLPDLKMYLVEKKAKKKQLLKLSAQNINTINSVIKLTHGEGETKNRFSCNLIKLKIIKVIM